MSEKHLKFWSRVFIPQEVKDDVDVFEQVKKTLEENALKKARETMPEAMRAEYTRHDSEIDKAYFRIYFP